MYRNKNEQVIDEIDSLLRMKVTLSRLPHWLARIEHIDHAYCPERRIFQRVYSLLDSHENAYNKPEEESRVLFREKFYGKRNELKDLVSVARKELKTVRQDIASFNDVCKNDFLKHGHRGSL